MLESQYHPHKVETRILKLRERVFMQTQVKFGHNRSC